LKNHLKFSQVHDHSTGDSLENRLDSLDIKAPNTPGLIKEEAVYGDLPIIEPPTAPCEYTDMWFEILRKSREVLSPTTQEPHPIANKILDEIKKIVDKDCQIFALLNALYGNSYIDLSRYMGNPNYLSRAKLERFRKMENLNEGQSRNNLIANWLKYVTKAEIDGIVKDGKLNPIEKAGLLLYTNDKLGSAEEIRNSKSNIRVF